MSERVGALLGSSKESKQVEFLGYGEYVGDSVPEEAVGFLADMAKAAGITNPKIELDNGEVVYGCECWWGPEDEMKKKMASYEEAGYEIVEVSINEARAKFRSEEASAGD